MIDTNPFTFAYAGGRFREFPILYALVTTQEQLKCPGTQQFVNNSSRALWMRNIDFVREPYLPERPEQLPGLSD